MTIPPQHQPWSTLCESNGCGHRMIDHSPSYNANGSYHAPCLRCACVQYWHQPTMPHQYDWTGTRPESDPLARAIISIESLRDTVHDELANRGQSPANYIRGMAAAYTIALLTLRAIDRDRGQA